MGPRLQFGSYAMVSDWLSYVFWKNDRFLMKGCVTQSMNVATSVYHSETWYVHVDGYFFTEDLRQFSFGRIGVLKEV